MISSLLYFAKVAKFPSVKPVKKKRITITERVDNLGHRYEQAQLKIDEGTSESNIVKEEVKTLASTDENARDSAKGKCVVGREFVVGYFDRGGTPKFDEDRFAVEQPKLYAKCTVMRRMFDETQFEELVRKNVIPEKLVKQYVVKSGVSRVAYIKRKDAKE